MVSRLEKVYPVVPDQADDAVFEGETSRPDPRPEVLERFGLAEPGKGVAQNVENDIDGTILLYISRAVQSIK